MMMGIGTPKSQSRMPLPIFSPYVVRGVRMRSFQMPLRSEPPSAAARLADKAQAQRSAKTKDAPRFFSW